MCSFYRVVRQAGINTSKQGNGEKAETNQMTSIGRGSEKQSPVTIQVKAGRERSEMGYTVQGK